MADCDHFKTVFSLFLEKLTEPHDSETSIKMFKKLLKVNLKSVASDYFDHEFLEKHEIGMEERALVIHGHDFIPEIIGFKEVTSSCNDFLFSTSRKTRKRTTTTA